MNSRCTVCNHSRGHDINLALLAGTTLNHLKQQFGLSRSALHRHKQHLKTTIDQAEDRMRHNFLLGYLFQLNDYNAAAAATVVAAREEGNGRLTLQAANAGARIINAMAKFEVDLDRETMYRLMTSPQYVQSGCLLPGDPQVLTGPRATLASSLAAVCPETDPDPLFDPEDLEAYLKLALEPDANTCLPQAHQLELPGFLVPLAAVLPAAALGTDPSSLFPNPCLSEPQPKRDASGTEAGQTKSYSEINEEILREMQVEQISGTKLDTAPAFDPLPTALCPPPTASCGTNLDAYPASDPLPAASCRTDSAPGLGPSSDPLPSAHCPLPTAFCAPETLDVAQAAELAEYLADFAPYAEPAPDPKSEIAFATAHCPPEVTLESPGTSNPGAKPPPPYDETARRADELFEMSHGYKRHNPPKYIPNRRLEEDFRSHSIFGDIKNVLQNI